MKKILFKHIGLFLLAAWVYTLTFVFNNYWSKSSSIPAIASSMQKRVINLQKKFATFYSNDETIKQSLSFSNGNLVQDNNTDAGPFNYLFADSPDGFVLKYWSTSMVVPKVPDIPYHDTVHLVRYENGWFLLSVHRLSNFNLFAAQLIPIKWQYFIQNGYLKQRIPGIDGLGEQITIRPDSVGSPVKLQNGNTVFYMQAVDAKPIYVFNWPSFLIAVITTILLITFLQRVANNIVSVYSFFWGLLFIVLAAIGLRLLIFYYNFPINTEQIEIFKHFENGNRFWFRSLGDLFLHLFGFIWVFYFLAIHQQKWLVLFNKLHINVRKALAIAGVTVYMCTSFGAAGIIQQLALQKEISFNVSDIFGLGWPTFFSISCLYFILSIHYRILHFCNEIFDGAFTKNKFFKFWPATFLGLFVLTAFIKIIDADLMLFVMIWSLLCLLLEQWLPQMTHHRPFNPNNFLFWMLWYALSGTLLLLAQNTVKNDESKMKLAQRQAKQSDEATESLLYQAVNTQMMQSIESQLPALKNKASAEKIIDDLEQKYFPSYLNKQQTSFYLFNTEGSPIYQKDSISFFALNITYDQQSLPTKHPNVSYYENSYEKFNYIIKRSLYNDSLQLMGYLFITYAPFQKETLVPELFRQLQTSDPNFTGNYTYAIYSDSNLISSNKDYPFKTLLDKKERLKQEKEIRHKNGTEELWFNAGGNKTIVVVKTSADFTDGITLFAYLFGIFILFLPIRNLLSNILAGKPIFKKPSISKLSIRNQIQNTILTLSTVSFAIIGIITVVFFIYRFHTNNNSVLTKTIERVNNDMEGQGRYGIAFDKKNISSTEKKNTSSIQAIAQSQNVDINLFDTTGNLITSSQPIVYERSVVSSKINPTAFYHLSVQKEVQFMQAEHIGELEYNSIYLPIRESNGTTKGYLNIPDFASHNDLNQEISNFLVALINLFVFIFLLTGIITFIIADRITSSFVLIAEKMKNITFGKQNDPIFWQRNDEIGILVAQYNRMLKQLDESANKLAKSERENAWREMAKQVAHEIKNPLTPMKLSLQYLQRAIDSNSPNVKNLTEKVATNMVEQIDHLSKIASDFSQFAHIGIEKRELLDLDEMIEQSVTLYENNKQVNINWQKVKGVKQIMADKTQVSRLFNNLFKNAVEASRDDHRLQLTITETVKENQITICIADNGMGIPDDLRDKIFVPNFTTKSSGTGLGLAICKDIVERMNGEIWFITQLGEGTKFYVRLPLVEENRR